MFQTVAIWGGKNGKDFFFFEQQLNILLYAGQIDVLLFRITESHVFSNDAYLIVYLELEIMEFLVWHFCLAHSDLIPCGHMKGLLFSFNNSVATVYFMFVLSCYEFLH